MQSLKSLSDNELLNRTNKLVKQERNLTLSILSHLIEIENRRLYRPLGYSSMYVYCTDGLGYSESSAYRRIYAARALRKCPEAYADLRNRRTNLGALALVWKHITPELMNEIRDKSYRQVQAIVSRFNPMAKHRDVTRPVTISKPVSTSGEGRDAADIVVLSRAARATLQGSGSRAVSIKTSDGTKLGENSLRRDGKIFTSDEISTPAEDKLEKLETVRMHQIRCLVTDDVMQKLDRCKELLSGKYPCGVDMNELILELTTAWLEKHDPVLRHGRREKQPKVKKPASAVTPKASRHISRATRDVVYNRDGGRCAYVGSDGKRCNSTWDLEIHHDGTPFALGGDHSIRNLTLFCATHNKLESERIFPQARLFRARGRRRE